MLRGQIDITARLIWIFEKLGWACERPLAEAGPAAAKLVKPAGDLMRLRTGDDDLA